MKVLVTGSHGFIGSALVPFLENKGHGVFRLVRSKPNGPSEIQWDPLASQINATSLEGFDAVIHLAAENIAAKRWSARQKKSIWRSRIDVTQFLSRTLARLHHPPRVLIAASATGYYGDRGDEMLYEDSLPGEGFVAELCQAWEQAAIPAQEKGIRVVNARLGVVLDPSGGMLRQMLPVFRLGLGGRLGDGRQYLGWIALADVLQAMLFLLEHPALKGPFNIVSPNPVTNAEFTRTVGRVIKRPTFFSMPAILLRIIAGEIADELILASVRVYPRRLLEAGFQCRLPQLDAALQRLIFRQYDSN